MASTPSPKSRRSARPRSNSRARACPTRSAWRTTARRRAGNCSATPAGMLKMLIHEQTREILGVHAIGTGATELIHIGQTAIAFRATVDYFLRAVFNYPYAGGVLQACRAEREQQAALAATGEPHPRRIVWASGILIRACPSCAGIRCCRSGSSRRRTAKSAPSIHRPNTARCAPRNQAATQRKCPNRPMKSWCSRTASRR
jgi:hypothetical protein